MGDSYRLRDRSAYTYCQFRFTNCIAVNLLFIGLFGCGICPFLGLTKLLAP